VGLSLVDKEGNPSSARLYVRVTQDSISAVAGDVVEQAQMSAKKLSRPPVPDVSGAVSDKQSLVTSFDALLMQFRPLIKIGDEISKVCSPFFPVMIRIYLVFPKDPSLCQFCLDGAFSGNEGEFSLIIDPSPHIIDLIRLYWPNKLEI
jgi:hypothetical protein